MSSRRRAIRGFQLAACAVALALLFFSLVLFDHQEALLFHPIPWVPSTPDEIGRTYEELTLTSADGLAINAWWIPVAGARSTILYCGGNVDKQIMELGGAHHSAHLTEPQHWQQVLEFIARALEHEAEARTTPTS